MPNVTIKQDAARMLGELLKPIKARVVELPVRLADSTELAGWALSGVVRLGLGAAHRFRRRP